ncbi:hypothetical protein [Pseudonocardia dioxanivorans]|uniref:hypothetical protein n=1 Tax=Pseudonocardia dioxanivorans TaxID=240495 RepID=UPI0010469572|nr:hypothetical protein [Pseudonocardia dioxanivorans]
MKTEPEIQRDRLAVAVSVKANPASLVGSFFHGQGEKWRGYQGCVVAEPAPGFYLCEFFDWLVGGSKNQQLVRIEDMIDWWFYDDADWMSNTYENDLRHRWDCESDTEGAK